MRTDNSVERQRKGGDTLKVRLKIKKACLSVFAIVLLGLSVSVPALAMPAIDTSKVGSITINVESAYGAVSGVSFSVYQVANVTSSGSYTLTTGANGFSGSGVVLSSLTTASLAEQAAKTLKNYAVANSITGSSGTTNASGTVAFTNLTLGYYLVVQTTIVGADTISDPFLVAVPMKNTAETDWIYDVVSYPKAEIHYYYDEFGAILLEKVDDEGTLLPGAVFRLDMKVYYSTATRIPAGAESGTDSTGTYYWSTYNAALTTNAYGQIGVSNLSFGQYRFIETTAPEGYVLDTSPYNFTISSAGAIYVLDGRYVKQSGTVQTIVVVNSLTPSPPVEPPESPSAPPQSNPPTNTPDFNLPQTGDSIANALCTYGGIVLVICGIAVFIGTRKKKHKG